MEKESPPPYLLPISLVYCLPLDLPGTSPSLSLSLSLCLRCLSIRLDFRPLSWGSNRSLLVRLITGFSSARGFIINIFLLPLPESPVSQFVACFCLSFVLFHNWNIEGTLQISNNYVSSLRIPLDYFPFSLIIGNLFPSFFLMVHFHFHFDGSLFLNSFGLE